MTRIAGDEFCLPKLIAKGAEQNKSTGNFSIVRRLQARCRHCNAYWKNVAGGREVKLKSKKRPTKINVDVHEALEAICSTGKGRCWYCDAKLPAAPQAINLGWDVQRIDDQPVASVILVCPECLRPDSRRSHLHPDEAEPLPAPAHG